MNVFWGDTMRETIISHLRDLKLSGMLAVYDEVLEEGRRTRSTPDKTLLRLLTAEVTERQTRSRNYRLVQARFPSVKGLETFDFTGTPLSRSSNPSSARMRLSTRPRQCPARRRVRHRQNTSGDLFGHGIDSPGKTRALLQCRGFGDCA